MAGVFYCGDNLEVLNEYVPDESVDLVYLDPPFNSQRTYNVTYKDSRAQEEAFKDYWSWEEAAPTYSAFLGSSGVPASLRKMLATLHDLLIDDNSDLLAYLTMMTPRMLALYRVLRPCGSLYLHCDPNASHYLKIILDAIFSTGSFSNEIVWARTNSRSTGGCWPRVHDILLYYRKSESAFFEEQKRSADALKLPHTLITGADGLKYQTYELTAPGRTKDGESGKPWRGKDPDSMGRHWANGIAALEEWDASGLIHWPKNDGFPRRLAAEPFVSENRRVTVNDVWTDIDRLNQTAKERLGYPTQKPLTLLDRVILSSSRPGDLVLDPFCGCGTAIESAEQLKRRWVGIDIAALAVELAEKRFEKRGWEPPEVIWHPSDLDAAEALARRAPKQFETWALRKVRAVRRRNKDRGIDGEAMFREANGKTHHVVVSVKGGKALNPGMVRDLRGTIERERSSIGVFLTMYEPSKEMRLEASRAGFLSESDAEGPIPRLQIVTIERVFSTLPSIRCPGENRTEMPPRVVPERAEQMTLNIDGASGTAKATGSPRTDRKKQKAPTPPLEVSSDAAPSSSGPQTRKARPGRVGPRVSPMVRAEKQSLKAVEVAKPKRR